MTSQNWADLGLCALSIAIAIGLGFWNKLTLKKHPKLYGIINLPIVIYPYVYMIAIAIWSLTYEFVKEKDFDTMPFIMALFFLIHILTTAALVGDFLSIKNDAISDKALSTYPMVGKLVQIPAFIIHFFMGAAGSLMSIWGIGFVMFAVIIDILTIVGTGLLTTASYIYLSKRGKLPLWLTIVGCILSFIYCVDIVTVIVVKIYLASKNKTSPQEKVVVN